MIEGKKLIIIIFTIVVAIAIGTYLLYQFGPKGTLEDEGSIGPHANVETMTTPFAALIS